MLMKRFQRWLALGTGAMILAIWAMHPRAAIQELSRHSRAPRSAPELPAPPVACAGRPLQVGPDAKVPESSPSLDPDREARTRNRKAPLEGALGARDSWEFLRGIPPGVGEMGREAALRKTAEHLSIDPASRPAFFDAARQSVLDMEQARALRSREVSALGVVSPSVGNELRSSTERYAAAREGALGRVEPYLGQSPASQNFRLEFDAWAALVVSKGVRPNQ